MDMDKWHISLVGVGFNPVCLCILPDKKVVNVSRMYVALPLPKTQNFSCTLATKLQSSICENMFDVNFAELRDRAVDVDPDLRFMALQDFQKYVATTPYLQTLLSTKNIDTFIPKLYDLLEDGVPDVQSHAVRLFARLSTYLSKELAVEVIDTLYKKVGEARAQRGPASFTTTVPTMALRGFLQAGAGGKVESLAARSMGELVVDLALPEVSELLDALEILTDGLRLFGYALKPARVAAVASCLVDVALSGALVRMTRMVMAGLSAALTYCPDLDVIAKQVLDHRGDLSTTFAALSLILQAQGLKTIHEKTVEDIFIVVASGLDAPRSLDNESMVLDSLDFDQMTEANQIMEQALGVLLALVRLPPALDLRSYNERLQDICGRFLKYDPWGSDNDMESHDDEIEFSDEEYDGLDNDDGGAWKIRAAACRLLSLCSLRFGVVVTAANVELLLPPVGDSNDFVAVEAIKTLGNLIDRGNQNIVPLAIEVTRSQLFGNFAVFAPMLKLVSVINDYDLVRATFQEISGNENNISSSILDILQFYKYVAAMPQLEDEVRSLMLSHLLVVLDSSSYNLICEAISVIIQLYSETRPDNESSLTSNIVHNLKEKVANPDKRFSSDLIQLAIQCLGQIVSSGCIENPATALETVISQLTVENNFAVVLLCLIDAAAYISANQAKQIFHRLTPLVVSNDDTICTRAITLLKILIMRYPEIVADEGQSRLVVANVIRVVNASAGTALPAIDDALAVLEALRAYNPEVITALVSLINRSTPDAPVGPAAYRLVKGIAMSQSSPNEFYYSLKDQLDDQIFASARMLATIACSIGLDDEISANEVLAPSIFVLNFLGCCADLNHPVSVDIHRLMAMDAKLPLEIDAIAHCVGLVSRTSPDLITVVMDVYSGSLSLKQRTVAVSALRGSLTVIPLSQLDEIFDTITQRIGAMESFSSQATQELKSSGEVLADISMVHQQHFDEVLSTYGEALSTNSPTPSQLASLYTIIAMVKLLATKLEDRSLLSKFLKMVTSFLAISNIEIRQAVVGTLLTALHNRRSVVEELLEPVILPMLFAHMAAESHFLKTIQMGPYKYILDGGIEIRKLIYEFLYSVVLWLSPSCPDGLLKCILRQFVTIGLVDNQLDVNILACLNISHMIELHPVLFEQEILQNPGIFSQLIEHLNGLLAKNTPTKAPPQDIEAFEDRLKSMIKLVKQVEHNYKFVDSYPPEVVAGWQQFYAGVKLGKGAQYL